MRPLTPKSVALEQVALKYVKPHSEQHQAPLNIYVPSPNLVGATRVGSICRAPSLQVGGIGGRLKEATGTWCDPEF